LSFLWFGDRDSTPGAAENLPPATFQTSLLRRVPARSNPKINHASTKQKTT